MQIEKKQIGGMPRLISRFSIQTSCGVVGITALLLLAFGLWDAKLAGTALDRQMRHHLVHQAMDVASTINSLNIRPLSFTAADMDQPEFRRLCAQLRDYADAVGIESLYTMALKNGEIVFGPESLPEGHPQASPPGTVYLDPSQADFDIFKTGRPQIQGPVSDEYGSFVTASAPVFDRYTGEILAVIGIDTDAVAWRAAVRGAQWHSARITMSLMAVLFSGGLILRVLGRCSPERIRQRRRAETVVCATFLFLLTVVLAGHFRRIEQVGHANQFDSLARPYAAACAEEFYDMRSRLTQMAAFFTTSSGITREEFRAYCTKIVQEGIVQACVWLPQVPEADVPAFIESVRTSGFPDFSIWQKNPNGGTEPVLPRSVCFPALYIEPLAQHINGLGYDLSSEPERNAAIQEALNTGLSSATEPVCLIAVTNQPQGIFIFQKVDVSVQKGVTGFVVRPENLLGSVRYRIRGKSDLNICLFELRNGEAPLFIAGSSPPCGGPCWDDDHLGLDITIPVFCFGKTYALRLLPDPAWLAANPPVYSRTICTIGFIITLLISMLVSIATNRQRILEQRVESRTAELKAGETLLNRIINTIPARVFWKDNNLIYLGCNEVFAHDAGFSSPQDIIGKDDYQMGWRDQAERYRLDDRQIIESGQAKFLIEEPQTTPDGRVLTLLTSKVPLIGAGEEVVGILGTYLDITDRKQAEDMLNSKVVELKRWQSVILGREDRIGELKKEVNELSVRLGRPIPYSSVNNPEQEQRL